MSVSVGENSKIRARMARGGMRINDRFETLAVTDSRRYLPLMASHHDSSPADIGLHMKDGSARTTQVKRKRTRVTIGGSVVYSDKASAAELKQAVKSSAEALNRMSVKISKPGIRLHSRAGIPLFSVDPDNPSRIARKLNGKLEWGVFENGQFKVGG